MVRGVTKELDTTQQLKQPQQVSKESKFEEQLQGGQHV